MQVFGLIAIGFVLGVLATVLFGRKIAAMVVADAKAVAFDAGRVVSDTRSGITTSMSSMEWRLHAKLDALKAGAVSDAKVVVGGLRGTLEAAEKKL